MGEMVDNPSYRPVPFWFLNHKLSKEEIQWQVDKLKEMGLGGAVLHSRHGRETPYLSEEWFTMLETAIRRGRKHGMEFWLYDEDNWPSGPAGMKTWEGHPEYLMSYLYQEQVNIVSPGDKINVELSENCKNVVSFPVDDNNNPILEAGGEIINCEDNYLEWQAPEASKYAVYVFAVHSVTPKTRFYDCKYLDLMNADAVRQFIEITHEKYAEKYKDLLQDGVRGIFTDEPASFYGRRECDVQYTDELFSEFKKRKGYDLRKYLPALFSRFNGSGEQIRIDFYDVIGQLYQENFFKQIYDWCEEHGLELNGHMMSEGEMPLHVRLQTDFFRNTKYMHQSGVDHLGLGDAYHQPDGRLQNLLGPKFASSAAHLLGKEVVDSEAFGEVGWTYDLSDLKRLFDSQLALGVNYIIPHAFYYSIQGFRKGECPPDEFWRVPFCENHYHTFADYIGNACRHFSGGRHLGQIGVLMPYRSWWAEIIPGDYDNLNQKYESLVDLSKLLSRGGFDWDLMNEEILLDSHIEKEVIKAGPQESAEEFEVLIIPDAEYLQEDAITYLEHAAREGVNVILLRPGNKLKDKLGMEDNVLILSELNYHQLNNFLPAANIQLETEVQGCNLLTYSYKKEGTTRYFIFNDGEEELAFGVKFKENGVLYERDLEHDKLRELGNYKGDYREINLPPFAAKLLEVKGKNTGPQNKVIDKGINTLSENTYTEEIRFSDSWDIDFEPGNALLLKDWYNSFRVKGEDEVDHWQRFFHIYKSEFKVSYLPDRCILITDGLVNEHVVGTVNKRFELNLNGDSLDDFQKSSILDHYLYQVDITDKLRLGSNKLIMESGQKFYEGLHIADPMIIMGDFGAADQEIIAPPEKLRTGDWVKQGFPYFAGIISYKQTIDLPQCKKAVLTGEGIQDAAEVIINGQRAGELCWSPWRLDVTGYLKKGKNKFAIRVSNGLANIIALRERPAGILKTPRLLID